MSKGYSSKYLTDQVATGRENYYTGAVAAGEPPGRWYGQGAAALGLSGLVDTQGMTALYEHLVDPRDPSFGVSDNWTDAGKLGSPPKAYRTAEDIYFQLVAAETGTPSPERRAQLHAMAEKAARQDVMYYDATFNVPKSVTVLHAAFEAQEVAATKTGNQGEAAAWKAYRVAVEEAIWAGNRASLDYLQDVAGYSRIGHHGGNAGRWIDAHEWTVASFFQHDNRDHEPHLHIHNAVFPRVECSDGQWRKLDGNGLYRHRPAASAIGERTMEEHLYRAIGVPFATRPDGKAREVVGIPQQVTDLFSTRRRAITAKTAKLVAEYEAMNGGRSPNALELDRLQRMATLATRKAKSHTGETARQRLARWDRQLRAEVAGGLRQVATTAVKNFRRPTDRTAGEVAASSSWSPRAVMEAALTEVQAERSTWTRSDLARAVSNNLTDNLGGIDARQVRLLIDTLTDEALERGGVKVTADGPGAESLPAELRLANGTSAYRAPGSESYVTVGHLRAERILEHAASRGDGPAAQQQGVERFLDRLAGEGIVLGVDQAAAVRGILTSGRPLEALVGPAGTGKSFTLGVLARAWTDPATWPDHQEGRAPRVVGLATSERATQVLAAEGLNARNIARWLAAQERIEVGTAAGDDVLWLLRPGDLVVVDEAAMTDTAQLTAIQARVQAAGAKLLLTGDHRQLAAVGAGGGMGLVADTGARHELTDVRRFTHTWERDASLRFREGDPTVLGEYYKHGRIIDAGTVEQAEQQAARSWIADHLAGRWSLLPVDTNEQAARVSAQIRGELVRLGKVAEDGVSLDLEGTTAGVGDLVQARSNAWNLVGYQGNQRAPQNRVTYRVLETHPDGSMTVTSTLDERDGSRKQAPGRTGKAADEAGDRIVLPAAYVAQNVALGYASTTYADQGLTVHGSYAVITGRTSREAGYVDATRGAETNIMFVATQAVPDDAPDGAAHAIARRSPVAILEDAFAREAEQAALAETRDSAHEATSVQTAGELFADVAGLATARRTGTMLDRLVDTGTLTQDQRDNIAASDAYGSLTVLLRRAEIAGHNPEQVLTDAITQAPLKGLRDPANGIHARITKTVPLQPVGDSYADWTPAVDDPTWQRHLTDLAASADQRRDELGAQLADDPPQWAIEALGPPPEPDTRPSTERSGPDRADADRRVDELERRGTWERRAGTVAAHRELVGHDDPAVALPGPPKPGQVEKHASWHAARTALGLPEAGREEAELTDGQLRLRVRAKAREEAWQPPYVAHELAGTSQAEHRQRRLAQIRAAEAEAATDPDRRADLDREAADAAALAETLAEQRVMLEEADHTRGLWYAHTAATRDEGLRAQDELDRRGIDDTQLEDHTTAEQWLADHAAADKAADPHRAIASEYDLTDLTAVRTGDEAVFDDRLDLAAETPPVDIRETTASDPQPATLSDQETPRVPEIDETVAAVGRARRALTEIHNRQDAETRRLADEQRVDQLTQWHSEGTRSAPGERAVDAPLEPSVG